jgi:uncharacterized cupredoxin-like copper-binding protein
MHEESMSNASHPGAPQALVNPAWIAIMSPVMDRTGARTMNNRLWPALTALVLAAPSLVHAADPWLHAEPLTVVMLDNRFEPDHIVLHTGRPYELRLENHGKEMHEFTAPAFLRAATIRDKHLLSNAGTDIVVQAGKSATVVLIAPGKGQYDLSCADHDWDGMAGGITVD